MENLNIFGKNQEEIGSLDKNLVLRTKGRVYIRFGRKYIELIDDKGNINVKIPKILTKVNSKDEMKDTGFYLLDGDLYACYNGEIFQITGVEGQFVSYAIEQNLTQENFDIAQKNIGLKFKNLKEAQKAVTEGIVFIGDKLYYINKGTATELFVLNEPLDSINNAGLGMPSKDLSVIIFKDGKWQYDQAITLEYYNKYLKPSNQEEEEDFKEKEDAFDLIEYSKRYNLKEFEFQYSKTQQGKEIYGATFSTSPSPDLQNGDICVMSLRGYAANENGIPQTISEDSKVFKEEAVVFNFIYEDGELKLIDDNGQPTTLMLKSDFDNDLEYFTIGDKHYTFVGGLRDTLDSRKNHLYVKAEQSNSKKFKLDYQHAEIALEENYPTDEKTGQPKIIPHTVLGDLTDEAGYYNEDPVPFRTYEDRKNTQGLYSDQAVFNGAEFRGPWPDEDAKDNEQKPIINNLYNYPRYSEKLDEAFLKLVEQEPYDQKLDQVIPPYGVVKLNQPLRSINLQTVKNGAQQDQKGLQLPNLINFADKDDFTQNNNTDYTNSVIVYKGEENNNIVWEYRKHMLAAFRKINKELGDNNEPEENQTIVYTKGEGNDNTIKWRYGAALNRPLRDINKTQSLINNPQPTPGSYSNSDLGISNTVISNAIVFDGQNWKYEQVVPLALFKLCCDTVGEKLKEIEDSKEYTISWLYEKGGAVYTTTTVKNKGSIVPPSTNPTMEGYQFLGWDYTQPEGGVTSNMSIAAKWKEVVQVFITVNPESVPKKRDTQVVVAWWATKGSNRVTDLYNIVVDGTYKDIQFDELSMQTVNNEVHQIINVKTENEIVTPGTINFTATYTYDDNGTEKSVSATAQLVQQDAYELPDFDLMKFHYEWNDGDLDLQLQTNNTGLTFNNSNLDDLACGLGGDGYRSTTKSINDYRVLRNETIIILSEGISQSDIKDYMSQYLIYSGDCTRDPFIEEVVINFGKLLRDITSNNPNRSDKFYVYFYAKWWSAPSDLSPDFEIIYNLYKLNNINYGLHNPEGSYIFEEEDSSVEKQIISDNTTELIVQLVKDTSSTALIDKNNRGEPVATLYYDFKTQKPIFVAGYYTDSGGSSGGGGIEFTWQFNPE